MTKREQLILFIGQKFNQWEGSVDDTLDIFDVSNEIQSRLHALEKSIIDAAEELRLHRGTCRHPVALRTRHGRPIVGDPEDWTCIVCGYQQ